MELYEVAGFLKLQSSFGGRLNRIGLSSTTSSRSSELFWRTKIHGARETQIQKVDVVIRLVVPHSDCDEKFQQDGSRFSAVGAK